MSKRIAVSMVGLFLALGLTGCGGKNEVIQNKQSMQLKNQEVIANKDKNGEPPTELTAACDGKVEGDACEATMSGDKKISGTCKKSQDESMLVCFPQNGLGEKEGERPEKNMDEAK